MVEALSRAARTLATDYDITEMLDRLCADVSLVLGVDGAGVMLEDGDGHLRFAAASDETLERIESLQIELDEGPCLSAYQTGEEVVVGDLEESDQFPRFGPPALEIGMRSVFSFPMRVGEEKVGALNLYRRQAGVFEQEDAEAGQILADVATVSILNARQFEQSMRLAEQLQHALNSRVVIEQAKGKLSEQFDVDVDEAFQRLRSYARGKGLKLHEIAQQVVDGVFNIDSIFSWEQGES